MKLAAKVARYLLGIGMVVFGLNAFFDFMPPHDLPEKGGQFMGLQSSEPGFPLLMERYEKGRKAGCPVHLPDPQHLTISPPSALLG